MRGCSQLTNDFRPWTQPWRKKTCNNASSLIILKKCWIKHNHNNRRCKMMRSSMWAILSSTWLTQSKGNWIRYSQGFSFRKRLIKRASKKRRTKKVRKKWKRRQKKLTFKVRRKSRRKRLKRASHLRSQRDLEMRKMNFLHLRSIWVPKKKWV